MRKIILFMHVSPDGFVAGPNGEMNWIKVDEEIFDDHSNRIRRRLGLGLTGSFR